MKIKISPEVLLCHLLHHQKIRRLKCKHVKNCWIQLIQIYPRKYGIFHPRLFIVYTQIRKRICCVFPVCLTQNLDRSLQPPFAKIYLFFFLLPLYLPNMHSWRQTAYGLYKIIHEHFPRLSTKQLKLSTHSNITEQWTLNIPHILFSTNFLLYRTAHTQLHATLSFISFIHSFNTYCIDETIVLFDDW